MTISGYDETLVRYGLEALKNGVDLQVDANGNIALTDDFQLLAGDPRHNAMFRFVERWRASKTVIEKLFALTVEASTARNAAAARMNASLDLSSLAGVKVLQEAYELREQEDVNSSTVAGSIAVLVHNLLMRLKQDLKAPDTQWKSSGTFVKGFSVGVIFAAAAANFRHYDEWAKVQGQLSEQQKGSMVILSGLLDVPLKQANGRPTITENVCDDVLMAVTQGDVDELHDKLFEFAKALASFP